MMKRSLLLSYPNFVNPSQRNDFLFFSQDGSLLYGGGLDAGAPLFTVWSASTGELLHTFRGESSLCQPTLSSIADKLVSILSDDSQSKIRLYDVVKRVCESIDCPFLASDEGHLWVALDNCTIERWEP